MYKVILTIKEARGQCPIGYHVGEKIVIVGGELLFNESTVKKLCLNALSALIPYLTALVRKTPASDWINSVKELQCPDSKNTIIFDVDRVKIE